MIILGVKGSINGVDVTNDILIIQLKMTEVWSTLREKLFSH